jgi:hypothetical protein
MGDLSKSDYVLRRQAARGGACPRRAAPPFDLRLDKAEELLADFGRVRELEGPPHEAPSAARNPLRSRLARRRHDRRREAA